MNVKCRYDELVSLKVLDTLRHPKNRNGHPAEQIIQLSKIMLYQGVRHPIVVSKLSGKITKGHGRLDSAIMNGWTEFPVEYQDYENEEQEYADIQSDNAIALWAELDLKGIGEDITQFGPDFDISLLGIEGFTLDPSEKFNPRDEWEGMPEYLQEKNMGVKSLVVHFKTEDDVRKFADTINQTVTMNTRSIFFPEAEREKAIDKRYVSES